MTTDRHVHAAQPPEECATGAVVVAVDGSRGSIAAVDWAAREAVTLGRRLRLVHAIGWPYTTAGPGGEEATALSAEVLAEASARARSAAGGGIEVVTESVWGRLGPLLVDVSGDAHTVALGLRAGSGFAGMMLGSRAVAVATRATGPVVVVPEAWPTSLRPPRPVVVVGTDAGQSCVPAVRYAFDHAARRGYALEAVAAEPSGCPLDGAVTSVVQEVGAAYRGVTWGVRHAAGSPAEALTAAAADAALLVVGCRTRRDRSSPLLDSVSRGAIFLARCPVAVV
jgi:nucleotide-binding universal stress UspA family protein